MAEHISDILFHIKKKRPFIFCVSNYFTIDFVVNGLRSMGAIPIMSNAIEEIEELIQLTSSVVINLGKLDPDFIKLTNHICKTANEFNKPIILEPTGAGATHYRTDVALRFLDNYRIAVIHGFEREIAALLNHSITLKDGLIESQDAFNSAQTLSAKYDIAVVTTGQKNTVFDSGNVKHFNFESELLLKVVGINGLLSAIIGTFQAVESDRSKAVPAAVDYYGICVMNAIAKANGPASFKTQLLDALYMNSSELI